MEEDETFDGYWLICPYCGHKHEDAWEICTENEEEHECAGCGKTFFCWSVESVDYCAKPIGPED